jgi:hypothetical protein
VLRDVTKYLQTAFVGLQCFLVLPLHLQLLRVPDRGMFINAVLCCVMLCARGTFFSAVWCCVVPFARGTCVSAILCSMMLCARGEERTRGRWWRVDRAQGSSLALAPVIEEHEITYFLLCLCARVKVSAKRVVLCSCEFSAVSRACFRRFSCDPYLVPVQEVPAHVQRSNSLGMCYRSVIIVLS